MRAHNLTALTLGAILAFTAPGFAQQQNPSGFGGALDTLNRAVNPAPNRDDRSRDAQDSARGLSGSSRPSDSRVGQDYRNYTDSELRDEANRLRAEQSDLQAELNRRSGRR